MKTIVYEDQIEVHKLLDRNLKWLITPEIIVADNFTMNIHSIKPGNTAKPAHTDAKS